ncbi:DMT family transporter, partial [Escherichia coli]
MKKNKYSTPLWVLATILAGMLSPMQSAVNGQLGHWLQDGNACAVISFASGLVVMFFIIMARKEIRQQFAAIPSLIKNRKVGNDSNLLIVFYVQIMPDDFVMQLHR